MKRGRRKKGEQKRRENGEKEEENNKNEMQKALRIYTSKYTYDLSQKKNDYEFAYFCWVITLWYMTVNATCEGLLESVDLLNPRPRRILTVNNYIEEQEKRL